MQACTMLDGSPSDNDELSLSQVTFLLKLLQTRTRTITYRYCFLK
ncbi:UNVERIFIED_CONTAM: hypothetical protein H355_000181, partial [Colinus virginianus]